MSQLIERKTDGGLAEQIEMLEAFADSDNAELLCLLLELRRRRESQAEVDQQLANSVAMAAGYAVANSKNLDRAEAAEADNELGMQLIKRLERQVLEYQAKMAELDNQKPYAYEFVTAGKKQVILSRVLQPVDMLEVTPLFTRPVPAVNLGDLEAKIKEQDELIHSLQETVYRYSGPAPAVNLVDLVPSARPDLSNSESDVEYRGMCDGWNSCRAAILRNIEEATNGQAIPSAKVGSVADTEVQAGSEASGEEKSA